MPFYLISISYILRPKIIARQVAFMIPEYNLQVKLLGSLSIVEAMVCARLFCLMVK